MFLKWGVMTRIRMLLLCILPDKEFLLYFIWPLPGTLMAESDKTAVESGKLGAYLAIL